MFVIVVAYLGDRKLNAPVVICNDIILKLNMSKRESRRET